MTVEGPRVTRAHFLRAAAGAAALGVLPARAVAAGAAPRFRSRPDLRPPPTSVVASTAAATPAYSFLGPSGSARSQPGPLIVDAAGQPVWFHPLPAGHLAASVKPQIYKGRPVLTWWQGKVIPPGFGQGEGLIVDTSYREIARVRAARGRYADLHEFQLTPRGTALITCYPAMVPADLRQVGGPRHGHVAESIIQEIDVVTGRLLMEWRSLDHLSLTESYASPWGGFDHMHANSIEVMPDGNLLVSARHTWALYKLARRTGHVMWRLGGKRSNFALRGAARFAWQHDARLAGTGTITVFDDGAGQKRTETQSRGLVLSIDEKHRVARLVTSYRHPHPLLASAMGSMQTLANGHVVLGWGTAPWMSEFDGHGSLLWDLRTSFGCQSYRSLRSLWVGTPRTAPAVAASIDQRTGHVTLYASWNGATEVAAWEVRVGLSASSLEAVALAPRRGFETAIALGSASGWGSVAAVNSAGHVLGASRAIRL